jgi:hypothetical protein
MAGTNHATRWNRRTWTAFEEAGLITGTTNKEHSAKAARAKSRQRLAATAMANPRGVKGTKYTTTKRSNLILYLADQVQ